jgi:Uri superfamily endonuclease
MAMQKGIYCLIIYLRKGENIKTGKLGEFFFRKGYYIYTGSSQNCLQKRLARHLAQEKKMHWHIDYLLKYGIIKEIMVIDSSKADECNLSNEVSLLSDAKVAANRFGASDCNCKTHLYFFNKKPPFNSIDPTSDISILKMMKKYYGNKS